MIGWETSLEDVQEDEDDEEMEVDEEEEEDSGEESIAENTVLDAAEDELGEVRCLLFCLNSVYKAVCIQIRSPGTS